jgi:hypothetical protein
MLTGPIEEEEEEEEEDTRLHTYWLFDEKESIVCFWHLLTADHKQLMF